MSCHEVDEVLVAVAAVAAKLLSLLLLLSPLVATMRVISCELLTSSMCTLLKGW